jgi:hypothetical protein
MHTIGCLLTFIIALFIAVLVAVRQIISRFFGIFRKMDPHQQQNDNPFGGQNNSSNTQNREQKQQQQHSGGKQKLFDDNEGEYIDFEEIREKPDQRN